MNKKVICIGDLGHTTRRMPNNFIPLNIGFIGAYAAEKFSRECSIHLFKDPYKLVDFIKENKPSVLALSNYVWNHHLSMHVILLYKQVCPSGVVVVGGPNIPLDMPRMREWLVHYGNVDFVVMGEGEAAFNNILQRLSEVSFSAVTAKKQAIPGVSFLLEGDIVFAEQLLIEDLNILPSPYLNGMMDEFLLNDTRGFSLIPMVEGSRGCPFLCTFCRNGRKYNSKIRAFDTGRFVEEIDYIAAKIKNAGRDISAMLITDQNFGMLKRDVEISDRLARLKASCGFPLNVMVTTGKASPDMVIDTVSRFDGIAMTMAVQSLDKEVLRNIRRINFPIDKFIAYHNTLKEKGRLSKSDVIMGLPGDTVEKHLDTLRSLINIGIDVIDTFSFMMLLGTFDESPERRKEFGFRTKWRLLPGAFSVIGDTALLEPEEIVVATNTFSEEDYVYLRRLHLLLATICNGTLFIEVKKVFKERGLDVVGYLQVVDRGIEKASAGAIAAVLREFTEKSISELFDSPKALLDFYRDKENYNNLCAGRLGENLLQKYRFQLFQHLGEFTEIMRKAFGIYAPTHDKALIAEEQSIFNLLEAKSHCLQELICGRWQGGSREFQVGYDVVSWKKDGNKKLAGWHLDKPHRGESYFSSEQVEAFRKTVADAVDDLQKARVIYRLGVEFLIPTVSIGAAYEGHQEVKGAK